MRAKFRVVAAVALVIVVAGAFVVFHVTTTRPLRPPALPVIADVGGDFELSRAGGKRVRLERLSSIKIAMFVGDSDLYWKEGMERTRDRLAFLGTQVYFEVIPRNGHFLPDLSFEKSSRIFERIGR